MKIFKRLMSLFLSAAVVASTVGITAFADIPQDGTGAMILGEGGYEEPRFMDQYGNEIIPDLIPDGEIALAANASSSYFNLIDEGRVASYVKDQANTNTCWAHAALASSESSLITKGYADRSINFSVGHLAWFVNGPGITDTTDPLYGDVKNQSTAKGAYEALGSPYDAIGALTSWTGAELESRFPFSDALQYKYPSESMRYDSYGHLQNAYTFDKTDTTSIKNALVNNGALTISFYTPTTSAEYLAFFNSGTAAYMSNKTTANHAVTLVGWDDNFSRTNFNSSNRPTANGAWICKNSYGEDYGKNGVFYISYEDPSIRSIFFYDMEKTTNYNHNYQYDGAIGVTTDSEGSYYNFLGIQTDWTAANVYTSEDASTLSAVGFYSIIADTGYKISIIRDISTTPSTGTVVSTQSGTNTYVGYHTVKLNTPVQLKKGEKFAVAITTLGSGSNDRYFAFDNYSPSTGLSYYVATATLNSSTSWRDAYTDVGKSACIKAYTTATVTDIKPKNVKATAGNGQVTVSWDKNANVDKYAVYTYINSKFTMAGMTTATSYTVTGLTNNTKYGFMVRGISGSTWSQNTTADVVYATPTAGSGSIKPTGVKATAGNGQVTVSWDKNANVDKYAVYTYINSKFTMVGMTTDTSYTVTGLTNNTKYGFMVRGISGSTWSQNTTADVVYATPTAGSGSIKPTGVKATAGNGQVTVSWDKNANVDKYAVYTYINSKFTMVGMTTATSYTVTGLTNNTKYGFMVRGISGSTWSQNTVADVVYATPTAGSGSIKPTGVKATAGNGQVIVSWDKNANVDKYAVYTYINSKFTMVGMTTNTSYTVTGLTNNTKYGFMVRGISGSTWSQNTTADVVYATPIASDYDEYPILTATPGNGRVNLSWTSVSGALSYVVCEIDGTSAKEIERCSSSTLSAVITTDSSGNALQNGTTYSFVVLAFFDEALTDYTISDIVDVTPVGRPSPVLTATAGDCKAILSWTAVEEVLYYKVCHYVTLSDYNVFFEIAKVDANTLSYTVEKDGYNSALENGQEYSFSVKAVFDSGETDTVFSNTVKVTPVETPKFTNFKAVAGDGEVTLTWDTPSSSSSNHFVYIYTGSLSGAMQMKTVKGTTITVPNLSNGTTYGFKVETYVASVGKTISSDIIWATPVSAATVVKTPPVLSAQWGGVGGTLSSLSWTAPNGATSYKVFSVHDDDSMELVEETTSTSVEFPSLTNGREYTFVVRAYFDPAETIYTTSNSVSVIPTAYSDSEYQNIVATAGDGKITLSWYAPYIMYSTPFHSVYYFAAAVGSSSKQIAIMIQGSGEVMTTTISGLTNDVEYGFYVTYFHPTNRKDITSPTIYAVPNAA